MPDDPNTGTWRSQKWCLTVPKMVPDHRQAPFLGLFLISLFVAWRLAEESAGSHPTKALSRPPLVVRHHIWDLRSDSRNGAWQSSGTIFGTIRHQFWDCQAPVLGLSGTSFGISRLILGYKKEPELCNKGCYGVFKGVLELPYVNICYISSHSDHVNDPFNKVTSLKFLSS